MQVSIKISCVQAMMVQRIHLKKKGGKGTQPDHYLKRLQIFQQDLHKTHHRVYKNI